MGSYSNVEVPTINIPNFKIIDVNSLTSRELGSNSAIFSPHPWFSLNIIALCFNKVLAYKCLILPPLVYFICFAKQSIKAYIDKLEKFIDSLYDLFIKYFKELVYKVNFSLRARKKKEKF